MDEKGSEYILAHTGPRRAPPGGVWVGVWFRSRLYYPFGKGPGQGSEWAVRVGQRLPSRFVQSGAARKMNLIQQPEK